MPILTCNETNEFMEKNTDSLYEIIVVKTSIHTWFNFYNESFEGSNSEISVYFNFQLPLIRVR